MARDVSRDRTGSATGDASHRSWFSVSGDLEPIDYHGPSDFRFPEEVAEFVIARYSQPGDWVLDPFAGFGTTLVVAERLGRRGVGFEIDAQRAQFAASRVPAGRVINSAAEDVSSLPFPPANLLFTSPPYGSFRDGDVVDDADAYSADAQRLFGGFLPLLRPDALLVVEVSQVREGHLTRPLVWHLGAALSGFLDLREDVARINTGSIAAGPGYDHAHVLVFAQRSAAAK